MAFAWKSEISKSSHAAWFFCLSTKRYSYSFCTGTEWDEQLTAFYVSPNANRMGQIVQTYRDQFHIEATRSLLGRDVEQILFVAHLYDGDLVQINKNDVLDAYWLIHEGRSYWLDADYAGIVQQYLQERHNPSWIIHQMR